MNIVAIVVPLVCLIFAWALGSHVAFYLFAVSLNYHIFFEVGLLFFTKFQEWRGGRQAAYSYVSTEDQGFGLDEGVHYAQEEESIILGVNEAMSHSYQQ